MPKNNLRTATKKSIYENKVQQLDNLGTDVDKFLQEESLTVIENVLGDFVERVHENINKEKNFVTTGKINDISIKGENGTVNVYAHKYLIYQSRGVNGSVNKYYNTPHAYTDKMPPVQVFKDWIKEKNIRLVDNAKYYGDESPFKQIDEETAIENAAWAMSRKVFEDGFKPRNIIEREYPKLIEDLKEQVANFCVQAIVQFVSVKEDAKRIILPK